MAFREICVIEIKEMLRLWQRGRSGRGIARVCGADRKTVARYIEQAEALGFSRDDDSRALDDDLLSELCAALTPSRERSSGTMREHCRTHSRAISDWRDEGCKGPKIVKLLKRTTGVSVPLRTLQRFIKDELLDAPASGAQTMRIADPDPGQVLEIDFLTFGDFVERGSGKRRTLHGLLCLAPNSRHQFVWPCLSQTFDDVVEGLEAAWAFFGGVFPVLLPDNLKAIVLKADFLSPAITPRFLEYAQSRDFEVDPARVRKPKDKARVERQVRFVRDDFFAGERLGSLDEWRAAARRWCLNDAGLRTHGTTTRQPLKAFELDELPLLRPAPSTPYDTPIWVDITLGRDQAISVGSALYSVPYTLQPGPLRVRLDRATVKVFRDRQLVKVHPRAPGSGSKLDPADYPPGKAALATRDIASLQQMANTHGSNVGEYARRLLEGGLPWQRMRHVYRLLALPKRFGPALVDAACAQALALDVVDVTRVTRILERKLVQSGALEGRQAAAPSSPEAPNILRFARPSSEWRVRASEEDGDAPA